MDNGRKSLSEVFSGNKFFSIPYYQRGYAWTDKQLQDFFDDFNTQYKVNSYYYGTVLLFRKEQKFEKEYFEIVDGQQRLTTLVIFVACMVKRMRELGFKDKVCDRLYESFVKNDDDQYILRLQPDDDDFFATKVLGDVKVEVINTPSQKRLLNAKTKFTEWLKACHTEQLTEFMNKIYSTNILVYLINSSVESAMIFETTNDRGKPLTNLEKTKSYLMYKACVLTEDTDQIISKLQTRFNQIYRDYAEIESLFPDENSLLQYSFIAYSDWNANSNKFKKEYQNYMDVMKDKVETLIKKSEKTKLNQYIEEYTLKIQSTFETMKAMMKNQCNALRDVIAIGNIANFYPLLIKCYDYDCASKENFAEICRLCEIFSFRVYVILGYISSKAQTTWYTLARDFKGNFAKLKNQIIMLINSIDDDEKFIEKLTSKNFFNEYNSNEKNYFFWKYENYLRANEQPVATPMPHSDLFEKENRKLKLSIEHIVAQRNGGEKSKIVSKTLKVQVGQATKFDKEYLHSIGNLTIDPQSANSSKGKQDVKNKIDKYFIYAPYKCQNELKNFLVKEGNEQKWTIKSIENRRDKILNFAKETWCTYNHYQTSEQTADIDILDEEKE